MGNMNHETNGRDLRLITSAEPAASRLCGPGTARPRAGTAARSRYASMRDVPGGVEAAPAHTPKEQL